MRVAISAVRTKDIRLNRYELIEQLQLHGCEVLYIGKDSNDKLHPDYNKFNVKFIGIPIYRTNTNPLREINTIIQTYKVLKQNKIDGLIIYGIRTFPTMVFSAKLAGVKKVLCIVNGSGRLFRLRGLKSIVTKMLSYPMLWLSFLLANNILFQNIDDLNLVKGKGLLWKKNYGLVNGSGVNLNTYSANHLEKQPVFTMIGRLTGDKGVNEFVKAAFLVKKSYPNAKFNLIGPMDNHDKSLKLDLINKAIESEIIQLQGKVEDVRPYINQSRIFVLPSYYEGTPRSTLEAMAMGRPIITTDVPGCRETVIDGVNGFKVQVQNYNELANKMIWMIENPEEVEKMGLESRRICEDKFDVYEVNKKIVNTLGI